MNQLPTTNHDGAPRRLRLIRDIATFQVKLIVDGLRDLVLVPASLVAGFISLFGRGEQTGEEFYSLLRVGKRSEKWINLFGAIERNSDAASAQEGEDIDRLVRRVEDFMVDEYRHGRLSGQARDKLDGMIARLQAAAARRSGD